MRSMPLTKYTREISDLYLSRRLRAAALAVRPANRETALRLLTNARKLNLISFAGTWIGRENALRPEERKRRREAAWKRREGLRLAKLAGYEVEGSTYERGDHIVSVHVRDFVPARLTAGAPYFDMGGEGLAVIAVTRKRVYSKSCGWSPSEATSVFLVGRNEVGTYFAHPIASLATVEGALTWIWEGAHVIARQGDIALVQGGRSRYVPPLPRGHKVTGEGIVHDTHAPLRLPGKGERIVVGRRAQPAGAGGTRD